MNPHLHTPILIICMLILSSSSSSSLKVVDAAVAPIIAKPVCQDTCGNVIIPFPFGIGAGCFLDAWYEITCNNISAGSTKAFLSKLNIEVMNITLPDYGNDWLQSLTVAIPSLKMCIGDTQGFAAVINLTGSPYNISTNHNVFMTEGCSGSAALINESNGVMAGCSTVCHKKNSSAIFTNKCYGVDCCQMPLPSETSDHISPFQYYQIGFYGESSGEQHNCLVASLIKNESVGQYVGKLSTSYPSTVPVLLYWSWLSTHWPDSSHHASCWSNKEAHTIDCYCKGNSAGNPYLFHRCIVPKDCKNCNGHCTWKAGDSSYTCQDDDISTASVAVMGVVIVVLCIATVSILTVLGCCGLYHLIKRRRKANRRVKFFKLKLQQHRSCDEGVVERTKLFTHKQLNKATDHFNESRVLGKGGQGTVYKGMLTDGRIVAIKTSKFTDESQLEQFVNEVVVLSQINHKHVVKLMGCCLEKEVPLLVYEFISNGTLSKHIHDPDEDFYLNWPMRLKIVADSAGAIAYLHSSSSTPLSQRYQACKHIVG